MPATGRGVPARRVSASAKRRSLRVYTEGEKTEPIYLTHWVRLHRERVLVSLADFHGTPLPLVEKAVAEKSADAVAARRGRGDDYDQYWCVFDADVHPRLSEAFQLARRHGIEVAFSNPCVELWFLLHFEDQNAHLERGEAQRRAREILGCGKLLTPRALALLEESHDTALSRARQLDTRHEGDGSPPGSNPSSSLWRLIEAIRSD